MTTSDDNDHNKNRDPLVQENRILAIKLSLAKAWIGLWIHAFDAMVTHRINIRSLPEYKDPDGLLDQAYRGDLEHGQERVLLYLERCRNGLTAAVRRSTFRKVD